MTDQKNTLLAIVLSAIVLIVWQYFFGLPHMQRQEAQKQTQTQTQTQTPTQGVPTPAPGGGPSTAVPVPGHCVCRRACGHKLNFSGAVKRCWTRRTSG